MQKMIFTIGQVAKICKVAPRTVSKWFDSGRLRGYRIPGTQDARIPREHLIRFLKEHGMPLNELEERPTVLFINVARPDKPKSVVPDWLSRNTPDTWRLATARSGFEAGIILQTEPIVGIVVNLDDSVSDDNAARNDAYATITNIRTTDYHQDVPMTLLVGKSGMDPTATPIYTAVPSPTIFQVDSLASEEQTANIVKAVFGTVVADQSEAG